MYMIINIDSLHCQIVQIPEGILLVRDHRVNNHLCYEITQLNKKCDLF